MSSSKKHWTGDFENKTGLSVQVRGGNGEAAIRIFTKKVKQDGIINEYRASKINETPSEAKRRRKAEAVTRWRIAQSEMRDR